MHLLPSRRARARLAAATTLAMASAVLPALALPAQAASTTLVISRVYGGGGNTSAPWTNDYIELFNRGDSSVDLAGLSLQYASGTGTGAFGGSATQLTELPALSVAPGQYVLVQEAGGAVGSALPAADVTDPTPINMSATGGKVALVTGTASLGCNGGSLPCDAAARSRIVDLVGFGTANFFEGSAAAPAASNTTDVARTGAGCADTDDNAADLLAEAPAPRTRATTPAPCGTVPPPGDLAPTVVSVIPADGATGAAADTAVVVSFSEAVSASAGAFDLTCAGAPVAVSVTDDGAITFTLTPEAALPPLAACTVGVRAAGISDVDDTPTPLAADVTSSFSTTGDACTADALAVGTIQGSGPASSLAGSVVVTRATVAAQTPGLNGFFVQDVPGDGDPATSDGVFVFVPSANPLAAAARALAPGDVVGLRGTVKEFNELTEIDSIDLLQVCSTGTAPEPTPVSLPEQTDGDLERVEGMLVTVTTPLTVQQNFFLGRYGQLTLGAGGRLYTPTNQFPAGSAEAIALADSNARSIVVLDDARSAQNPAPIPFSGSGPDGTVRAGDTVAAGLTGVLDYGPVNSNSAIRDYRLQATQAPSFSSTNPRTAAPEPVRGNLRVASFNVLNYFTTLGSGANARGATNAAEFERQKAKIVAAMTALDADVIGLIEIQNNGGTAIGDLVAALNTVVPGAPWAPVADPATGTGTDAIKVAQIYRTDRVSLVGPSLSDPDPINNRAPVAQTYRLLSNGQATSVVVNHFKSKGSCPAPNAVDAAGNVDSGDGQGCWNALRVQQAERLQQFLSVVITAAGDPDVLVVGDLNSYGKEDPILTLTGGETGLVDVLDERVSGEPYSYVFDGASGYLDHALATRSLASQVSGATEWHINADEPSVIDYNTEFKPDDRYAPTPYRSSDHDPVLVGLDLGGCRFTDDASLRVSTLTADCTTSSTIPVKDGWTLDGGGRTITAYDATGAHFTGAVVAATGRTGNVRNLRITGYDLADVCDTGAARLAGVRLDGASGVVRRVSVVDLAQTTSACEEGIGIEVLATSTRPTVVAVAGNTVTGYQKGGIVVDGPVLSTVTGNTVTGTGPAARTTQNGIQFSGGAFGLFVANAVRGNGDAGPGTSCGILLARAGGVVSLGNSFAANERNQCTVTRVDDGTEPYS